MSARSRDLENKPLIEAIFELRWKLEGGEEKPRVDPDYKLLIGRLYDKISSDYPIHVELPTAQIPDAMAAYVVQHQFRVAPDDWPLVQLGPGVVTLNETSKYRWTDFSHRTSDLTSAMYNTYAGVSKELVPIQVLLRYLDSFTLPEGGKDILEYLADNLKIRLSLPTTLFDKPHIEASPSTLELKLAFPTAKPQGMISIGLQKALRKPDEVHTVVMDMQVITNPNQVPQDSSSILGWIADAHTLAEDWFFKLIDGALLESFK
jgi:uncharacterized protein (TIGR04255 family)